MKCPECGHNQRRGQHGMVCTSCSYSFLLDPKSSKNSSKITDNKFLQIIKRASAQGTYQFTINQLYSAACYRSISHFAIARLVTLCFLLLHLILFFKGSQAFHFPLGLATVISGQMWLQAWLRGTALSRKSWDQIVSLWLKESGDIPGLIIHPALTEAPEQWPEDDVYDYGVQGLLICDRDEMVDWLVLNGFHTTSHLLIVSRTGYPHYLRERTENLLASTPDLKVCLLHDANRQMDEVIAASVFDLTPHHEVIDLGIDPAGVATYSKVGRHVGLLGRRRLPVDSLPFLDLTNAICYCLPLGVSLAEGFRQSSGWESEISFG